MMHQTKKKRKNPKTNPKYKEKTWQLRAGEGQIDEGGCPGTANIIIENKNIE